MITLDTLVRDIRHAFRSLQRDLGATVFVLAIAGIGIGASTTVFSICRALILRPLPFERPERLVWIANGTSENLSAQTVQVNNLLDLRAGSRSWTDVAGFFPFYAPGDIRLTSAGEPERRQPRARLHPRVGLTLGPLVFHLNALSVAGVLIVALGSRAWL